MNSLIKISVLFAAIIPKKKAPITGGFDIFSLEITS